MKSRKKSKEGKTGQDDAVVVGKLTIRQMVNNSSSKKRGKINRAQN